MKIESVLHILAVALAMTAFGIHVVSQLLFPGSGTMEDLPIWMLLAAVCLETGYRQTNMPETKNETPQKHNLLK